MALLHRVRAVLSGMPGGPGVSTMYFDDGAAAAPAVRAFWSGLSTLLPTSITVTVDGVGDIINDFNGDLTGQWVGSAQAPVDCTGAGPYAAPVGGLIRWETGVIVDSHRLRGRTFIVPLINAQFQDDGSLAPSTIGFLALEGNTLRAANAGSMRVWHRPFAGAPATATRPARAAHAGSSALVTGVSVPDKAVVLRSRRD